MSGEPLRDWASGRWLSIRVEDGRFAAVDEVPAPPASGPTTWVAPAFWDLQTNGRWGTSFSDPDLTPERAAEVILAHARLGVARLCPTLITAPPEALRHGVATIAAACDAEPTVGGMVLGIHLEGPSISSLDGYRGAHPLGAVRDPDWDEFRRLQDASGGRIILVTLAPERAGAIPFIERLTRAGVRVALGHTAADAPTIEAAVSAGARLSTHLGNGIATPLPRHPNPIWAQAADDRLLASFIADGHHLDPATLRVLLRAKGRDRTILVSDASPLAGLPAGTYGDWSVEPSGRIVVAGTPYLAGSNLDLPSAINAVQEAEPALQLSEVLAMASLAPARLLGCREPSLAAGEPADFVRFRLEGRRFELLTTTVDGRTYPPASASPRSAVPRPGPGMVNNPRR